MQNFDIILFALIAVFVVLRLRGVLGSKDGHKGKPDDYRTMGHRHGGHHHGNHRHGASTSHPEADDGNNVVKLPDQHAHNSTDTADTEAWTGSTGEDEDFGYEGALAEGIKEIRAADPSFNPQEFLDGASGAFEMILGAYAAGDTKMLKSLLSPEVFSGFAHAIAERESADQTLQETLVGINDIALVEAYMDGRDASVTVKFVSEQISALMDADGAVIEGDPVKVVPATDFWTFSRSTKSRNPNWTLVGTGTLV